jgi:molybdate transport system substrate-binding protein
LPLVYRAARRPLFCTALLCGVALAPVCAAQSTPANPKVLHVAAAADLQPVLAALADAYQRATGVKIIASFGSSATLTQQITNGDPQDLFLSADMAHPQLLADAKLTDGAPLQYATGALVLWARNDSPAQPLSLASLTSTGVMHIAVANDAHAPYGLAATQALRSLGLMDKLKPKLVIGENIAQTAQLAESGNAQVAFLSLTIAGSAHFRALGSFVPVPAKSYQPLHQGAVVLAASVQKQRAHDFLHWLTSAEVQQKLPRYGLQPAS